MNKFNHYGVGLAVVLVLSTLLQLMPQWHDALVFHSAHVMSEGWPLITAHFIHLNGWHAAFNLAGLVLIVLVWRELWTARWLFNALLLSAASTSILLWLLPFELSFVGLSGVLHGLLVYCLIKDIKAGNRWMWLILVAVIAKVAAELMGWHPEHFVGDHVGYIHAAGLLSALLVYKLERRRINDAVPHRE